MSLSIAYIVPSYTVAVKDQPVFALALTCGFHMHPEVYGYFAGLVCGSQDALVRSRRRRKLTMKFLSASATSPAAMEP